MVLFGISGTPCTDNSGMVNAPCMTKRRSTASTKNIIYVYVYVKGEKINSDSLAVAFRPFTAHGFYDLRLFEMDCPKGCRYWLTSFQLSPTIESATMEIEI